MSDTSTAFAETLSAAERILDAALALLPEDTWGDDPTPEQYEARADLLQAQRLIAGVGGTSV